MNRWIALCGLLTAAIGAGVPMTAQPAAVPACTPAPAGLWGWWPFDESAGTETVNLLGGPEGQLRNEPRPVDGVDGRAREFDGVNDYVDVPGDRLDPGIHDFSIALWIRPLSTTGVRTIIDRRDIGTVVRGYSLYLWKGQPGFQLADGTTPAKCTTPANCDPKPALTGYTNYNSGVTLTANDWHFVAVTVDRQSKTGGRFYVDGRMVMAFDPAIRPRPLSARSPLRIGAHAGFPASGHFHGALDELQFYRRALAPTEVEKIFAARQDGMCKDVSPTRVTSVGRERTAFVPGVIILKLNDAPARALQAALKAKNPFATLPFPPAVRQLNQRFGATAIEPVFRALPVGATGGLHQYFRLTIDTRIDAAGASATYAHAAGVAAADPDWIMRVQQATTGTATLPWQLTKVGASAAWSKGVTGKGVVVAVIDTGILLGHPALQANLWTNVNETPGNNDDHDGNGFRDDVHGWDFVGTGWNDAIGDADPTDKNGHGTHVAGTIAAVKGAGGLTGVAYEARLMVLRGLNEAGAGASSKLAEAIEYARANGAGVINNSWGAEERASIIDKVIALARSQGVVVVSAAGNSETEACRWTPGNAEGGLAVAATSQNDNQITMSNIGAKVDVGAPGDDIVSAGLAGQNIGLTGTSMAAPHVSGLAALLRQAYPGWDAEQIRHAIRASAKDILPAGFDVRTGTGRIDMGRALSYAATAPPHVAAIDEPANCTTVTGKKIRVLGSARGTGLANYELSIAKSADPASAAAFTQLASKTGAITDGVLAEFDPDTRDGVYTLRLVTKTADKKIQSEDRNVITIDNMSKPGWPVRVYDGAMKSPMVADLDRDGTKEVILGTAVFQADGSVRPGWEVASAGFGRTNPAVVDVDGDGRLEVVAAEWLSFDHPDETLDPALIGPVIRAYNADRAKEPAQYDWELEIKKPNSLNHHGIPSSISAADIDGDGTLEIVFTVYFDVDEDEDTWVFIVDAKTGKVDHEFTVAGRSISSVAFVPRGQTLGHFLAISSDTHMHLVDAAGTAVWSKPKSGGGLVDPVVADVDNDGKPEILAGRTLWMLDGSSTKLSTSTASPSTGSFGQLRSGCRLEAVVGGGKGTPYTVYGTSALFSVKDKGEEEIAELSDENENAGNPIVADLDGDGTPDLLGPSRRAAETLSPAGLYAWKGSSPTTAVTGFPRMLHAENGLIRSTATVDDIDGDGRTDVLVAGDGLLYAWTLDTPYNPANNPWPMFQHDLAHTGYLPSGDLWIEDTPRPATGFTDDGKEPAAAMAGKPVWLSRGLWVRNASIATPFKDDRAHQNPIAGSNQVVVWVRNRGCAAAGGKVEVLAAPSTLGPPVQRWSSLGVVDVPAIAPGASTRVQIPWTLAEATPHSLLARVVSEPLSFPKNRSTEESVRKNNNLAWRNVHLVNAKKMTMAVDVVNPGDKEALVELAFAVQGTTYSGLQVDLGPLAAQVTGSTKAPVVGNGIRKITGYPATITVRMAAFEQRTIQLMFDTATLPDEKQYVLVSASTGGVRLGGASYVIGK